jgi:hypothetical protein
VIPMPVGEPKRVLQDLENLPRLGNFLGCQAAKNRVAERSGPVGGSHLWRADYG